MKRLKKGSKRPMVPVPCHVVKPQKVHRVLSSLWMTLQIQSQSTSDWTPWGGDFAPTDPEMSLQDVSAAYLFSSVFSKFDDGQPSEAKEAKTWERFYAAEEQCRLSNERLRNPQSLYSLERTGPWSLIECAREKIEDLLGAFDWNEAAKYMAFGPGGSTRLPRRRGDAAYKYSGPPETTIGCAILADAAIAANPLWQRGLKKSEGDVGYCKIVPGNRIDSVPKNYKTNRMIGIEPCMNMFVQKGIGGWLRRKLRRVGVDLDDQTKNQRLALIGSFAGSLATIDLAMASDTISYEVVRRLLPPDWFEALEQCRSHIGVLPCGEVIRYHKFSSMGNGYTFELESLIFWALIQAVQDCYRVRDRRFAVYGDDLIVATEIADPLLGLLEVCGFTANQSKSFVTGPFRESCGKHYFKGHDVTPFYVKTSTKVLTDLFLLHNQLYRWCMRVQLDPETLQWISVLCRRLRGLAPAKWRRQRIPDNHGDGAFIGSFEECCPSRAPFGLEGFQVRTLVPVAEQYYPPIHGMLVKSILGIKGALSWDRSQREISEYDFIRPESPRDSSIISEVTAAVSRPPVVREITSLVVAYPSMSPFIEILV